MKCEKCGADLRETSVGYFMGALIRVVEGETNAEHTPERCLTAQRDRLAPRLVEVGREAESFELAWGADINAIRPALQRAGLHHYGPLDGHRIAQQMDEITSARDTLRAELAAYKRAKEENDERFMVERDQARSELAECRAELKREQIANAHDPVRQKLKAAEARAGRLSNNLAALLREVHNEAVEKCAETVWHRDEQDRILALRALAEPQAGEGRRVMESQKCPECGSHLVDDEGIELLDKAHGRGRAAERAAIVRYLSVWSDSVRDNEAIDGRLQALVTDTHKSNIAKGEHITRPDRANGGG